MIRQVLTICFIMCICTGSLYSQDIKQAFKEQEKNSVSNHNINTRKISSVCKNTEENIMLDLETNLFKEDNERKSVDFATEEELNKDENLDDIIEKAHIRVENMPSFPGGMGALMKFVGENLEYPQDAVNLGIEGTVVVKIVVNKQGKAVHPEILKSVNPLLDKAALDIIAKLPTFKPGEQAGEKVPVYFNLPVQFKLWRRENYLL